MIKGFDWPIYNNKKKETKTKENTFTKGGRCLALFL